MATRFLYGQTYDEIAIVAATPIPVDIGGGTINISGGVSIGTVTVDNTNASPVPVSDAGGTLSVDDGGGSITVDGPLTDIQLRASAIAVSDGGGSITVDGPLTDTQLRASAVPVSGPLTDTELRASSVPVSGPLTDTQLRASAVSVSGPLTDAQLRASAVPVNGPLTDTQLRATAVPVVASVAVRSPTTTSIASANTSVLVLAQNANRKGLMINNQSTSKLYLSFSNPASAGNSFIQMDPSSFLLLDHQMIFTSAIYGVWTSANGTAQITELA